MDYNTIIIGSGVAGMTAAIYLARAGISVCIIEKDTPGGQITRTSDIDNYPGFITIEGPELALSMFNQVNNLKIPYIFSEVKEIISEKSKKIVKTNDKELICENIIIATGRSPRKLNIKNEDKLTGRGISYCAICDGNLYKDKNVAVIGGGRAALEETLYLSKICNKVTLIHRRNEFRAEKDLVENVKNIENVTILTDTQVQEFIEEDNKLSKIILKNKNNELKELTVDGCFEYIGQEPNTEIFNNLNILDENKYIRVNHNYETTEPNIYAIGDCIKKDLYQIITACSDGAIVANNIIKNKYFTKNM